MKFLTSKSLKYAVLVGVGLFLVHIVARVVAGFILLDNVYSPSETEASLFWMGFWEFQYSNEDYPEDWKILRPMSVIGPHLIVAGTIASVVAIVFATKWYVKTSQANKNIALSVLCGSALLMSIVSLAAAVARSPY